MNVVEEVVAEELSPYKGLVTSVVPAEQDHEAAATSCFCVNPAGQSCCEANPLQRHLILLPRRRIEV